MASREWPCSFCAGLRSRTRRIPQSPKQATDESLASIGKAEPLRPKARRNELRSTSHNWILPGSGWNFLSTAMLEQS